MGGLGKAFVPDQLRQHGICLFSGAAGSPADRIFGPTVRDDLVENLHGSALVSCRNLLGGAVDATANFPQRIDIECHDLAARIMGA